MYCVHINLCPHSTFPYLLLVLNPDQKPSSNTSGNADSNLDIPLNRTLWVLLVISWAFRSVCLVSATPRIPEIN